MKISSFLVMIMPFFIVNCEITFLRAMDLSKELNSQKIIRKQFVITDSNSKNGESIINFLQKYREPLFCKSKIYNETYLATMLTTPILKRSNDTFIVDLTGLEKNFDTFYIKPLFEKMESKIEILREHLETLEKENKYLTEQLQQKITPLSVKEKVMGVFGLFFISFSSGYFLRSLNFDLITCFNRDFSVKL